MNADRKEDEDEGDEDDTNPDVLALEDDEDDAGITIVTVFIVCSLLLSYIFLSFGKKMKHFIFFIIICAKSHNHGKIFSALLF